MDVCFDTETTGTDTENDELLQITIVDDNCNVIFESYVHPPTITSWNNAMLVNHITPDMVQDAPNPEDIAEQIQAIFDNAEHIVAYNAAFDKAIVENCLGVEIDKDKLIDPLKIFRSECNQNTYILPNHKLGAAIDFYCPDAKEAYLKNAHDASCDAIATMKVYLSQKDTEKSRNYQYSSLTDTAKNILCSILEEDTLISEQIESEEIELE